MKIDIKHDLCGYCEEPGRILNEYTCCKHFPNLPMKESEAVDRCEFGCKNLETRCTQCGKLACRATIESKWISVKDRLPDTIEDVLIFLPLYRGSNLMVVGNYDKSWYLPEDYYDCVDQITHWMPLPETAK